MLVKEDRRGEIGAFYRKTIGNRKKNIRIYKVVEKNYKIGYDRESDRNSRGGRELEIIKHSSAML